MQLRKRIDRNPDFSQAVKLSNAFFSKLQYCHLRRCFPWDDLFKQETVQHSNVSCPKCGHNLNFFRKDYDPYFLTPSMHDELKSSMVVGEPCRENPSSKKAVASVINHIRKSSDLGYERKWTVIHCDGVPYYYAAKMQDELVVC